MADLPDSSPLSSPPATLGNSPPSEWFGKRASKSVDEAGLNGLPTQKFDADISKVVEIGDPVSSPARGVEDVISAPLTHVASSTPAGSPTLDALPAPIFSTIPDTAPTQPISSPSASSTKSKKRAHADIDKHDAPSSSPIQATIPESSPASKKSRTKNIKPTPAPVSTRPSRARKAPQWLGDLAQPPRKTPAPRKATAGSKVFDPIYITTNSKSRLVKTDLYHLLLDDSAWTCLTIAEKRELINMLPWSSVNERLIKDIEEGSVAETTRPKEFGGNFNLFRTDVAKFKEELGNGQLSRVWLEDSKVAIKERAEGKFDAWKADQAESWWGQKGE